MNVAIITNSIDGLVLFRKSLISELMLDNSIIVYAPFDGKENLLITLGCSVVRLNIDRHGVNPFTELNLMKNIYNRIYRQRPDVVLTYTVKPNIYGGIICNKLNVPYIVNITGLGTSIENKGLLKRITLFLYRLALKNANKVFFQNRSNLEFMIRNKVVHNNYDILPGSGVNLEDNRFEAYPDNNNEFIFTTVCRIMKDKGIDELLEAAKIIKSKYPFCTFRLIGSYDENIYKSKVNEAVEDGYIEYLGYQSDMHKFYTTSHAVIHPSYHEGMSNVLLEAAATGRPVLASNVPGCQETFNEGISGLGFSPRSVESLVETIIKFIELPYPKKASMGLAGRKKMEKEFDRQFVVDKYMQEVERISKEI